MDGLIPLDEALRWMEEPRSFASHGAREAARSVVAEVEGLRRKLAGVKRERDDARNEVMALTAELEQYRSRVTTGGPPAPYTPGWERGDSSRPSTAAPEDEVVELPVLNEEYAPCTDCGRPHPAWISCEDEVLSSPPE